MTIRVSQAGAQYTTSDRRFNNILDDRIDDAEEIMEEVYTDIATEIRTNVARAGVKNTVPTGDGRGTGKMENEVDWEVKRTGDRLTGRAGWLPADVKGKRRSIVGWQESGTRMHGEPSGDPDPRDPENRENRGIRPMFALKDASIHGGEVLRERLAHLQRGRKR